MAFTRTWQESYPDDDNYGYELDDYQRQIRVDVRERLGVQHKTYADESGHTDVAEHKAGECNIAFVGAKASFPVPASSNAGCLAVATDESNQLYYWSGSAWTKVQEPVLITGDQTIAGAKTFSGAVTLDAVSTIKDGSAMSTAAAPTEDAMIANKKYIDDQIDATVGNGTFNPLSYAGEESVTFPNGLIIKQGVALCTFAPSVTTKAITFASAFPNGCTRVLVSLATSSIENGTQNISATDNSTTGFNIKTYCNNSFSANVAWFAIGR